MGGIWARHVGQAASCFVHESKTVLGGDDEGRGIGFNGSGDAGEVGGLVDDSKFLRSRVSLFLFVLLLPHRLFPSTQCLFHLSEATITPVHSSPRLPPVPLTRSTTAYYTTSSHCAMPALLNLPISGTRTHSKTAQA